MIQITFEDIDSIIRSNLITQSQLNQKFVRNASSLFGTGFENDINDIFTLLKPSDTIIFFITSKRQGGNNVTIPDETSSIIQLQSYAVKVMIYGNASVSLSSAIIARFRAESIRSKLYSLGIYLEDIVDEISIYEFKNSMTWLRSDFTINIACEHLISPIEEDEEYSELNTLNFI